MIIVAHNAVSDLGALVRIGLPIPEATYFDTQVAAQWCWPDQEHYGLEHLVLRTTDMPEWRPTLGKQGIEVFDAMADEDLFRRCAYDAEAGLRLYHVLSPEIDRLGLRPIWDLAMDVLPTLAEMGGRGMYLDYAKLKHRDTEITAALASEGETLAHDLGVENLDSPAQVSTALFGPRFRATHLYRTQEGYSVDRVSVLWARYCARRDRKDTLESICTRYLQYTEQEKLRSTYYTKWATECAEDHRIRSSYSLGRTGTGRLASSKVNLQNIPAVVREIIIPSPGWDELVSVDFKQLELCIASLYSEDPNLIRWITEGKDLHALTATRVLGFPEPVTPEDFKRFKRDHPMERDCGKMANFSTIFGIEADSLRWKIFKDTGGASSLSEGEASQYISAFWALFPGHKQYGRVIRTQVMKGQEIFSKFGRRWLFSPDDNGWRQAMNYPIQSTASDIVLLVLRWVNRLLKIDRWKSRIIGEVHDSIIFETIRGERDRLIALVRYCCEHPPTRLFGFQLPVPLRVDVSVGPTLGSLVEV